MTARMRKMVWAMAAVGALAGCDWLAIDPGTSAPDSQARFTIMLMKIDGPRHVEVAKVREQQTKEFTGWSDVFLVHKEGYSLLFWGKYRSIDEAQPYLHRAKKFETKFKMRPFTKALVFPLPGKAVGPPEWNVENAPEKFCYSVLVADYFNVPVPPDPEDKPYYNRKQDAVAVCQEFRQKGWDAYYHHGPSHSGVMIGLFDESAVQIIRRPGGETRRRVVGPQVKQIQKMFPYLAVNGRVMVKKIKDPKTGAEAREKEKCRLIVIPGRKPHHKLRDAIREGGPGGTETVPDRPRLPF